MCTFLRRILLFPCKNAYTWRKDIIHKSLFIFCDHTHTHTHTHWKPVYQRSRSPRCCTYSNICRFQYFNIRSWCNVDKLFVFGILIFVVVSFLLLSVKIWSWKLYVMMFLIIYWMHIETSMKYIIKSNVLQCL